MIQQYPLTTQKQNWISILLNEDSDLFGQEYPNQPWTPLKDLKNPIRRSLCSNELVFDIDADSWESCHQLAKNLEEVLTPLGIPFLRFTSGRYLHYHVFFDKKTVVPNKIWIDYFKNMKNKKTVSIAELMEFLKELRYAIFEYVCSKVKPIAGAWFDKGIMKAEKHMIRLEGAMNEKTGFYKSLLPELPKEQPRITKDAVVYPDKIEHWNIPEELLYYVYHHFIRKKENDIQTLRKEKKDTETIGWIEEILQQTFPDGRKRLIDLVILPYLITVKGLDVEQTIQLAYDWALKNHEVEPIRINGRLATPTSLLNYIKYKAKRAEKTQLKPLSKDGAKSWFSDVKEVLEIVGG